MGLGGVGVFVSMVSAGSGVSGDESVCHHSPSMFWMNRELMEYMRVI